ncbi:MAG: hypothetical protein EZS28_013575 [Streblomastix strix]|uniref:Uncharacterized protein n=1 Tax=Streblomastix strix TaxID=222440 RepID=A0A5J4W846_9EUKA|nr:MAG: hypothetical protein EZS28_013575 [Streblomastix strix]
MIRTRVFTLSRKETQTRRQIAFKVFKLHTIRITSQNAFQEAQTQETQCLNLEFRYFFSFQVTMKVYTSQVIEQLQMPSQIRRILRKTGKDRQSAQIFSILSRQYCIKRCLDEVSRSEQVAIRVYVICI